MAYDCPCWGRSRSGRLTIVHAAVIVRDTSTIASSMKHAGNR